MKNEQTQDNNKITVKLKDKTVEVAYISDDKIETNFIEEDLEKTLDLTNELLEIKDASIVNEEFNDEQ